MNDVIRRLMMELARAQLEERRIGQLWTEADRAIEATELGQRRDALKQQASHLAGEGQRIRKEIQEVAVANFLATDDKAPAPGVTVKTFRRLKYDVATALAWCKTNAPTFVRESLDVKTFEKVAADLDGSPVLIESDPRAQIASDLSEYTEGG